MHDHRYAQVRHQETLNKASTKWQKNATGNKRESLGIQKLVVAVTSIMSLLAARI